MSRPAGGERVGKREWEALAHVPLPLDPERVRLYRAGCGGPAGLVRRAVLGLSGGRAVALGDRVFLPERCGADPAVLAHELTHCAQYQAWGPLRYYLRGATAQLRELGHRLFGLGGSQYAWRHEPGKPFDAYGMEQQGQIVEDSLRGHARAREVLASASSPIHRGDATGTSFTPPRRPGSPTPPPPATGPPTGPARFRPGRRSSP